MQSISWDSHDDCTFSIRRAHMRGIRGGGLFFVAMTVAVFTFQVKAPASEKVLYLTFDDGPSQRYTPKILDILKRDKVPATFFVVGYRCEEFPQLVRRIRMEGHEIGNHGYAHYYFVHQTEAVKRDVQQADEVIRHACGVAPLLYRPPGGILDEGEARAIYQLGHPIVFWTVDSEDWKTTSEKVIYDHVVRQGVSGSVILLHDGVSNSRYTTQALPRIIREFRLKGYVFKVLPIEPYAKVTFQGTHVRTE